MIKDAVKDRQTASASGIRIEGLPHGARIVETKNLVTANSITSEVFRPEWTLLPGNISHILQIEYRANAVSAWHMHALRTDCVFVTDGTIRLAMYDGRDDSPTFRRVCVINLSRMSPTIVTIPPGVWHGFKNLENTKSGMLNSSDHAYRYEDPDEWRLPWNSDEIPYRF